MHKQTNTLSPSPKGFQSPKFSDSDFREVCGLGLRRPKSSAYPLSQPKKWYNILSPITEKPSPKSDRKYLFLASRAATRTCSLVSCHCKWLQSARMQFEKLPLQLGSSVRIHAVCQFENLLFVDESNKVTHTIFSQKRPKICILDDNTFKMSPIMF
jgi:hypothetical protein